MHVVKSKFDAENIENDSCDGLNWRRKRSRTNWSRGSVQGRYIE
mgnify:CR=1 FL=1